MSQLRQSYSVREHHGSFYVAGGDVRAGKNGRHILCVYEENVNVVELSSGRIPFYLPGDGETITAMAYHPGTDQIVFSSLSQLMYHWKPDSLFYTARSAQASETGAQERPGSDSQPHAEQKALPWRLHNKWRAHRKPVTALEIDSSGHFLVSGSVDRTVRVWDLDQGYCTHSFQSHQSLITRVVFHPNPERMMVISADQSGEVKAWDLFSKTEMALSNHMSAVTSLCFSSSGNEMISAGRDNILTLWNLRSFEAMRTIPIYESSEALVTAPPHMTKRFLSSSDSKEKRKQFIVLTAGEKGVVRAWNALSGECLAEEAQPPGKVVGYHQMMLMEGPERQEDASILAVTNDSCFSVYSTQNTELVKQKFVVGFYDEIVGVKYCLSDKSIATICNSERVFLFDTDSFHCKVLLGHTNITVALDVSACGGYAATTSKDQTVRVWDLQNERCIALGEGHTDTVSAVAFSRNSPSFLVTGSHDHTIKFWEISSAVTQPSSMHTLHAKRTMKAHDKEINDVSVAPNNSIVATASQDKLAKIWDCKTFQLLGVLKGHRKGIWSVCFSTVDRCVATSSSDRTIRIWSLTDYSCLKQFEGHNSAVLRVAFISHGMQLLSGDSSGLVKLWTIRTNECVNTFEQHYDKLWALDVKGDGEEIVTGGTDSIINFWKDVTVEEEMKLKKGREEQIQKEQNLSNYLQKGDHLKALRLAFALDLPYRVLGIFYDLVEAKEALSHGDTSYLREMGQEERQRVKEIKEANMAVIEKVIRSLTPPELELCLQYVRNWNTNAKHAPLAQLVLSVVFKAYSILLLVKLPAMKKLLQALLPYSERHANRTEILLQKSYLVDYTLQRMHRVQPESDTESLEFLSSIRQAGPRDDDLTPSDFAHPTESGYEADLPLRRVDDNFEVEDDWPMAEQDDLNQSVNVISDDTLTEFVFGDGWNAPAESLPAPDEQEKKKGKRKRGETVAEACTSVAQSTKKQKTEERLAASTRKQGNKASAKTVDSKERNRKYQRQKRKKSKTE